jgi:hypothetical protein
MDPAHLPDDDKQRWPAVDDAYAFVLPSYQLLVSRFEAADTRLSALLTLGATLTLGAPVVGRAVHPDISFRNPLFVIGMSLFIAAAVVGMSGRVVGKLRLMDPMTIYNTALHKHSWAFKRDAIYNAGVHFDLNARAIRIKGRAALLVTVALLLEVLAVVAWIAR